MITTIHGREFTVADEPADFWGWVREGRYDHEWNAIDAFLKPEHTFIDLGAWVGSHSLYASRVAKQVVSVEPDPVAFTILEQNLKLNSLPAPHQIAITGYEGQIELGSGYLGASTTRANPDAGGGIGCWEPGHTVTVPCTTLRKFAEQFPGPWFIKIDVEGSEEEIVKDLDFFREYRPVVHLALHPFWFRNQELAWKNVDALIQLYPKMTKAHQEIILST